LESDETVKFLQYNVTKQAGGQVTLRCEYCRARCNQAQRAHPLRRDNDQDTQINRRMNHDRGK
ncbi:MAG: hypothetical protein JWO48_1808, partial [Bryobacterales bacterium]|nr:hypothetical protein [Bryobacterales bacterium]